MARVLGTQDPERDSFKLSVSVLPPGSCGALGKSASLSGHVSLSEHNAPAGQNGCEVPVDTTDRAWSTKQKWTGPTKMSVQVPWCGVPVGGPFSRRALTWAGPDVGGTSVSFSALPGSGNPSPLVVFLFPSLFPVSNTAQAGLHSLCSSNFRSSLFYFSCARITGTHL